MDKIIIIWNQYDGKEWDILARQAETAAQELEMQVITYPLSSRMTNEDYGKIKELDADYLMTFDMAGFEQDTLQEVPSYNMVFAKQIHILLGDNPKYSDYLCRSLSLNQFLFAQTEEQAEYISKEYPQLLNVEGMPQFAFKGQMSDGQNRANIDAIKWAIEKVRSEVKATGSQ